MKKYQLSFTAALLIVFVVQSCQSEKYTDKGIPEVNTIRAAIVEGGVTFYAEILSDGGQEVIERGFEWINISNPSYEESEYVLLGPSDGKSKFSMTINSTIEKYESYKVRSFIVTAGLISYGNEITFTGNGSKPSELLSVLPASAVYGDTVVITGSGFATNPSKCSVFFGTIQGKVISATPGEIQVIVPSIPQIQVKISVAVYGITSVNDLDFNILEPVLNGFSPASGTFGDIITLTGENFTLNQAMFKVYFNDTRAEITELSRTGCKVKVPTGNNISPCDIIIRYAKDYVFEESFSLIQAVITDVSPSQITGDQTIEISGSNFNPSPLMNRVEIGERVATVISSSSTSLTVSLPLGLFNGLYSLSVTTISGSPVFWSGTLDIKCVWTRLSDFPGARRVGAVSFVIGNLAYFGTGINSNLNATKDFWVYDPLTDHWSTTTSFPVALGYMTGFSIAGKGYATLGKSDGLYGTSLRSYDPVIGSWQTLSPIPGSGSTMDSPGFVINGKAYIPAGGYMYEYDPETDSWSIRSFPAELGYFGAGVAFSINGKGYLGIGWVHNESRDVATFFEYNPITDTWTRKASFPGTLRDNTVSFSLPNGKGYVGLGYSSTLSQYLRDMWEYDPVSDRWTQLEDFPSSERFGAEVFVIGNSAYIGTGGTPALFFSDFWRFTPEP